MALKNFFKSLFAGSASGDGGASPSAEPVDYNGYQITAKPIPAEGQYRTAGSISRELDGTIRESRFIRADNHASLDAAVEHSITKAKQIIDERAEAVFDNEHC